MATAQVMGAPYRRRCEGRLSKHRLGSVVPCATDGEYLAAMLKLFVTHFLILLCPHIVANTVFDAAFTFTFMANGLKCSGILYLI